MACLAHDTSTLRSVSHCSVWIFVKWKGRQLLLIGRPNSNRMRLVNNDNPARRMPPPASAANHVQHRMSEPSQERMPQVGSARKRIAARNNDTARRGSAREATVSKTPMKYG